MTNQAMSHQRVVLALAGPDVGLLTREFGVAATDSRFALAHIISNWQQLLDTLRQSEPDLLILYANLAPGPDALKDALSRLKRAVAVVLLPPDLAQFQGAIEQIHTVRKVYVLPVAAQEVLNFGYSAAVTERVKMQTTAPLQEFAARQGPTAPAVGTRVIAFFSPQGGTGKSTLAVAVGEELVRRSIRTLLMAFNLPSPVVPWLGLRTTPNAEEFFLRPQSGFRDAIQTTKSGLDVLLAPQDSYGYAEAALRPPDEPNSIRNLVAASYMEHYGAILLDLPPGEGNWTLQPLLAANVVLVVVRPTVAGLQAAYHATRLLTERLAGQHRIPQEAMFTVLNMRTPRSTLTASAFAREGAELTGGFFPPVLASLEFNPVIAQLQDAARPFLVVESLEKPVVALVDALFGKATGGVRKERRFFGIRIRVR